MIDGIIPYGQAVTIDGLTLIARGAVDYQSNPTLAAGDVKVEKDGGAAANITTLPTVTPAGGPSVRLQLSAAETQAKVVVVRFVDQTNPKEWEDLQLRLVTAGDAAAFWTVNPNNIAQGVKKNTGLNNFEFVMYDATDHVTPKTGLVVTAQRSIDGAAFAACTNAVAEVGNGTYKINLSAADLNGDVVTFRFTATGADPTLITIKTSP
ncbi:hypothetical protein [Candidatus Nitrospira bockiana]